MFYKTTLHTKLITMLLKKLNKIKTVPGSKIMGERVGEELSKLGIKSIRFDRNGRSYKGSLAALANAVREKGIQF